MRPPPSPPKRRVFAAYVVSAIVIGAGIWILWMYWTSFGQLRQAALTSPVLPGVGIAFAFIILWIVPVFQVRHSTGLTDLNRFDRENEARKTLSQILGGLFLLFGLYSSVQTLNLSREGQLTDRFTKSVEQLGALDPANNPKLEVRIGGIYALERIARDSDRDHQSVMEVLTTYVREHSRYKLDVKSNFSKRVICSHDNASTEVPRLSTDIQAILTVLGRRDKYDKETLDLNETDLSGLQLRGSNLIGISLLGVNLTHAGLDGTNFYNAQMVLSILQCAGLARANLARTLLFNADLRGADLTDSDLTGALLAEADLTGAKLVGANLTKAIIKDAILNNADLTKANVTQEQVNSALGDAGTQLPAGLKTPSHWHQ
jgi:uncharacterized protein YjbI with pentapeptide repeats